MTPIVRVLLKSNEDSTSKTLTKVDLVDPRMSPEQIKFLDWRSVKRRVTMFNEDISLSRYDLKFIYDFVFLEQSKPSYYIYSEEESEHIRDLIEDLKKESE